MADNATAQEEEKDQSLENFDWDDSGDFFGIEGTGVEKDEVKEVIKEVKKDDDLEEEDDDKENEEGEEKEESFFEEESEEEEESERVEDFYKSQASKLKEKGIFQNVEIPEDEEISEEKFIEFQDQEIEARVDEALEGFFEELDEDAAAFLKFKKEGGDTASFFKVYSTSTGLPEGDLEDEKYQEKLSRYYYKNIEGLDDEDIDDKIEWLKDGGKLEKYAAKHDTKIKSLEKKSKEDLQKRAKEQQKAQVEKREKFVSTVQETLEDTDEVDNFKFPAKEKKQLLSFITKPSVKVGKNRYITGMQAKLQEVLKEPEKMIVLAKLLNNDFDVADVVATTTTKKTREVKRDVTRSKNQRPTKSGKPNRRRRSLADIDL